MISWSVADFKSLGAARLSFPDLTVLAGANSSGKSSVLQSILMTGQSASRGGAIVLNGQLVRLGEPKDVLRDGQKTIEIGFGVEIDAESSINPTAEISQTTVQVSVSLRPEASGSTLIPSNFEITGENVDFSLVATSSNVSQSDATYLSDSWGNDDITFLRITHLGGKRAPNRMYLGCVGLRPVALAVHLHESRIKSELKRVLRGINPSEALTYEFYYDVVNFVTKKDFLKAIGKHAEPNSGNASSSHLDNWGPNDFEKLTGHQADVLKELLTEHRAQHGWAIIGVSHNYLRPSQMRRRRIGRDGLVERAIEQRTETQLHTLGEIATAISRFGNDLRYLGPLRDEPKVVHGVWDERVNSLPVGRRGELTADVLTREKDTRVQYRTPAGRDARDTLPDAVSSWCNYLGIGEAIEVIDQGKLGRGVTLTVEGKPRDLTMIGVGASQLLPIVVAGLSVPPESLVLIEQPELHLHPSVQSKLADFFLFSRPDVQYVIETHSEYLVTRIRRRIAEGKVEPGQLEVQFAEREAGVTNVRSLGLSELGDFEEWPTGFFDEQERDSRYIVEAIAKALAKSK
ncbi:MULTISPECIES: AAA family ATPase [unclassified Leucobacter]|uniref:AAA family ATPase n=1 Tax=unclassified Leucobacter TaxID=2621730 RepID=UPI0030199E0F